MAPWNVVHDNDTFGMEYYSEIGVHMRYQTILAAMGLVSILATAGSASTTAIEDATNWEIGPDVRGVNYSFNMPLKPTPAGKRGWSFDFPYPSREAGHVHAITYNSGPLINAAKIIMRYRISAARGVRFEPQESSAYPATVSLYFQRRGDNWTAKRKYQHYRWYVPEHAVRKLTPGEHEIVVNLSDPNWGSVHSGLAADNAMYFREALAQTSKIGIAFGTRAARAHGVYSTGSARFTLLQFTII